jgi:DNA replicative helicase MCM subunit Mcm2 (Cdc46/Mcm family)
MPETAFAPDVVARDTPTEAAVDTASRVRKQETADPVSHCSAMVLAREWIAGVLHRGEMSQADAVWLMKTLDAAEIREMEKQRSMGALCRNVLSRVVHLFSGR